jgi:hypothetical protein
MFRRAVDLFTPDEHAVLARWFNTEPPDIAKDIEPEEAASRLGFEKHPDFYLLEDAVVAFIVLEQVEQRLPQWSAVYTMERSLLPEHSETAPRFRIGRLSYSRVTSSLSIGPIAGRALAGRWHTM